MDAGRASEGAAVSAAGMDKAQEQSQYLLRAREGPQEGLPKALDEPGDRRGVLTGW